MVIEPVIGGAKRHVLDLLGGLDRQRFEITLVYSAERDAAFRDETRSLCASGVACVEIPMVRQPNPLADLRALTRLAHLFRRERFDVIHAHASKAGLLARMAALISGASRICYTPHVYAFAGKSGLAGLAFRAVEALAAPLTSRVIALTPDQAAAAVRAGVARPGQIAVIPNGIALAPWDHLPPQHQARAQLALDPNRPVVALAARLDARKRVDFFLTAASHALAALPGIQFAIAGHGPELAALPRLARQLGVERDVRFLGELPDIVALYAAADVVCLTSSAEGMPYALMEAMAARRPVVATRVAGIEELVPSDAGVLAPRDDPAAFAQALARLLADPPQRERMGRAGRAHVERLWPLERFTAAHTRLYESVAGWGRRRGSTDGMDHDAQRPKRPS